MRVFVSYRCFCMLYVFLKMVTCTGFEPVNAALRGQCVEPLHQHARSGIELLSLFFLRL